MHHQSEIQKSKKNDDASLGAFFSLPIVSICLIYEEPQDSFVNDLSKKEDPVFVNGPNRGTEPFYTIWKNKQNITIILLSVATAESSQFARWID